MATDLRGLVMKTAVALCRIDEETAGTPPAPGKWSPKEVLGHLIDSASNNHGRFVRAGLGADLRFPGYDQEGWVALQGYADASWSELVALWEAINLHLARCVERIPSEVLLREHTEHDLDTIAWKAVPADQPTTLDYFVRDYVAHLRHHLRQIDPDLG